MSRGHGVVQRFILDYLAAGHPEPDKRSRFDVPRKRRPVHIGHPLWQIAGTYAEEHGRASRDQFGRAYADRTTMASFGRAMATLRRAGLVEVRHQYDTPHLRRTVPPHAREDRPEVGRSSRSRAAGPQSTNSSAGSR